MNDRQLRDKYGQTLLGRLRLELFKRISSSEAIPSAEEQLHFLLDKYRSNPAVGKIYRAILLLKETHHVESNEVEIPSDVSNLLVRLEREPLKPEHFVELHGVSSSPIGVLVTQSRLRPSGFVYELTIFHDETLLQHVGRMEARACIEEPRPPFAVLAEDGFESFGIDDIGANDMLSHATVALSILAQRTGLQQVELERIGTLPQLVPPLDRVFYRLVRNAYLGTTQCAIANIPMNAIKPYSSEFCLTFPIELIRTIADDILTRPEKSLRIVVYWDGDSFVMSDDYGPYLAYRRLGYNEIPAVLIGDVPGFIVPTAFGGAELFPPFGVVPDIRQEQPLDESGLDQLIDEYVREPEASLNPAVASLYTLYFILAEIVSDPNASEADIHRFLSSYPMLVAPAGFDMRSEVRLGKDYRVDLLLQFRDVERQILLIELERADIEIFTKKGRPRAEITHATQQVEDWLRWWRENPGQIPKGLNESAVPKGAVVAGRSKNMDQNTRRRLTHLNLNRNVKVITYDDLLIRLEGLIRQLERLDSRP